MNTVSYPLVSIVTPVYNGAQYLSECIETVLAQTYPHWEYVIVDNCSTDGSAEIARQYAAKDRRIRLIENPQFLRALPNHNAALRQISRESKYCKIVFADDWIFPECLERMVARRHLLDRLYVFGSSNAVLFRSDLVRNRDPFFNEANVHADTEVCFSLLKTSDFGFVHQVLTFTRVRSNSRSTISSELHTYFAGDLQLLIAHAPDYLTHDEVQDLLQRLISQYYRFLGKSLLLRKNETIEYHRRKLNEAGVGFSWTRVMRGALETLASHALNPKGIAEKLLEPRDRSNLAVREQKHASTPNPIPHPGDTLE